MNVKRIKARTSREALAIIRQSLGDEAVILSNRTVPGGVEIMAMPAEDLMIVAGEAENAAFGLPPANTSATSSAARGKARAKVSAPPAPLQDDDAEADFASLLRAADPRAADQRPPSNLRGEKLNARDSKRKDANPPRAANRDVPKVAQPSAARAYRRQADDWQADIDDDHDHGADTRFEPLAAAPDRAPRAERSAQAAARGTWPAAANIRNAEPAAPAPVPTPAPAPGVLRAQSPVARKAAVDDAALPPASASVSTHAPAADTLARELAALRTLVETRLTAAPAAAATSAPAQPAPAAAPLAQRASLTGDLLDSGFSPLLAKRVMEKFPAGLQGREARDWLQSVLARNLQCARADQDPVAVGGVYAFVGPTGVGKTTTIAKLAARALVRHGAHQVALISADSYRIGAQDQLDVYGGLLGLPVRRVQDQAGLRAALAEFADRKLVLIDTAGMSQRDAHVSRQLAMLKQEGIRRIVLLNASVQAETLDDVVRAYLSDVPAGEALTIVTKLDEAVKLGGVVDCAIRRKLGLLYVTTGQRVPEDLHPAHARYLVDKALRHASSPVFARQAEAQHLQLATGHRAAQHEVAHA